MFYREPFAPADQDDESLKTQRVFLLSGCTLTTIFVLFFLLGFAYGKNKLASEDARPQEGWVTVCRAAKVLSEDKKSRRELNHERRWKVTLNHDVQAPVCFTPRLKKAWWTFHHCFVLTIGTNSKLSGDNNENDNWKWNSWKQGKVFKSLSDSVVNMEDFHHCDSVPSPATNPSPHSNSAMF